MVEQPVQRTGARSIHQVAKSVPATQSRPLSADDIQKAKMRAQFMQNKYGKSIISPNESQKTFTPSQASPSVPNAFVLSKLEEQKKLDVASFKVATQKEIPQDVTVNLDSDPPRKKCKNVQIPWQTPPEVKISFSWHVGIGEDSKEVEVQKDRALREREVVYRTIQQIPPNPREPWDREMDFDDLLTPEIPTEQMPDVEPLEAPAGSQEVAAPVASTSSQNVGGTSMPEPDLELLAELLKNPQLVFALTSGQAGEISSSETIKLLDMIKANGGNSLSSLAALGTKTDNKVEVSLPSPTPSSDPVTGGLKPAFSRNPFSWHHTVANENVGLSTQPEKTFPASNLKQPQIPSTLVLAPQSQSSAAVRQWVHQHQVVPPVGGTSFQTASQQWHSPLTPAKTKLDSEIMLDTDNLANSTLGNVQPLPGERQIGRPPSVRVQPHQPKLAQVSYGPEPTVSSSWRVRPGLESEPRYREIPRSNHYNAYTRGPLERNHSEEAPRFETWSPEKSPMRTREYVVGPNQPQSIMNSRHGYGPEREMLQNPSQPSGYWDNGRGGNRGWQGGGR